MLETLSRLMSAIPVTVATFFLFCAPIAGHAADATKRLLTSWQKPELPGIH
jgi:hypothetical protein